MDDRFRQEYCQQFSIDHEYEEYVKGWMIYHKTANQIDGHIKHPITKEDHSTCKLAAAEGIRAMNEYFYVIGLIPNKIGKWHSAKLEALRRLGE